MFKASVEEELEMDDSLGPLEKMSRYLHSDLILHRQVPPPKWFRTNLAPSSKFACIAFSFMHVSTPKAKSCLLLTFLGACNEGSIW